LSGLFDVKSASLIAHDYATATCQMAPRMTPEFRPVPDCTFILNCDQGEQRGRQRSDQTS
jgi:hypothetical protein